MLQNWDWGYHLWFTTNGYEWSVGRTVESPHTQMVNTGLLYAGDNAGAGIFINQGTFLELAGNGGGGTFVNEGVVASAGNSTWYQVSSSAGTFINAAGATISDTATNSDNGTFTNAGTIGHWEEATYADGTPYRWAAGRASNDGTFTNAAGATITGYVSSVTGTFTNADGATITGDARSVTGTFTNQGTIGGNAQNYGSGIFSNAATIGGSVENSGGGTLVNDGSIGGSVYTNGVFRNSGTLGGDLFLDEGSTFEMTGAGIGGSLYYYADAPLSTAFTIGGGAENGGPGEFTSNTSLAWGKNTGTGRFTNASGGTITGNATNSGTGTFTNPGTIGGDASNGAYWVPSIAATFINQGTIGGNAQNYGSGTFTNAPGATITGTATNSGTGTFTNQGTIGGDASNANSDGTTYRVAVGGASNAGIGAFVNAGTIIGSASNSGGGTFTNQGTIGGNAQNYGSGTFTNAPGATISDYASNYGTGAFTNQGTIGRWEDLPNSDGTTHRVAMGGADNDEGAFVNAGTIIGSASNSGGGTFTNAAGATITDYAFHYGTGTFTNQGTIGRWEDQTNSDGTPHAVAVGSVDNSDIGTFVNAGTIIGVVGNGGTFTNASSATISGDVSGGGVMRARRASASPAAQLAASPTVVNDGSAASFVNRGSIQGLVRNTGGASFEHTGTITGDFTNGNSKGNSDGSTTILKPNSVVAGRFVNNAVVIVKPSSGQLAPRVESFVQTSMGVLEAEFAGGRDTGNSSQLAVTGAATLDGELNVSFGGGVPQPGDRWRLFTADSVSGRFKAITAEAPGSASTVFRVNYNADNFVNGTQFNRVVDLEVAASTAIAFRKKGLLYKEEGSWHFGVDVPGWDHVGMIVDDVVYESHPGYTELGYYDPYQNGVVNIPGRRGVQATMTPGTFRWASSDQGAHSPTIAEYEEIPIRPELGYAMRNAITRKLGAGFGADGAPDPDQLREVFLPEVQKGAFGAFSCVGLLEWAAEQVGKEHPEWLPAGAEGVIPNKWESLTIDGVRYPTLSPSLLRFVLSHPDIELSNVRLLQAFIDPADFLLIDPLGRRLGHTASLGDINEIPGADYTGDGSVEQVFLFDPLPGQYTLQLFGLGEMVNAGLNDGDTSSSYSGFVDAGSTVTRSFTVAVSVPEPSLYPVFSILGVGIMRRRAGNGRNGKGVISHFHRGPQ